ncbi:MAG: DNA glycosylase AlkZ-like family protein [Promethearchaeota archaeon]
MTNIFLVWIMDVFSLNQVNKYILKKHHLTNTSKSNNIIQIVEDICGLHSTEVTTPYLSLFIRANDFKKSDLERELFINKNLGRIRGMRKTLFIQTKKLIPIVFSATFNLVERTFEKYMEFHKVTLEEYEKFSRLIIELLNGKEMSASEIRNALNSKANIPAIIQLMCNKNILIRAGYIRDWKDRRNKYALFTNYFPDINLKKYTEKEAIKSLVEKFIATYGPVSEVDISWWTGLTKSKIRNTLKNIESDIIQIKISSIKGSFIVSNFDINNLQNKWNLDNPSLVLLPALDPLPMGYKDRDRYIDVKNYNYIFDRSGNITSTIIFDGSIIGVWDVEEKPEPTIKFHLFHSIGKDLLEIIYSKAEKIGQFYFDSIVKIKQSKSMTSLSKRSAGGFMNPLKE